MLWEHTDVCRIILMFGLCLSYPALYVVGVSVHPHSRYDIIFPFLWAAWNDHERFLDKLLD